MFCFQVGFGTSLGHLLDDHSAMVYITGSLHRIDSTGESGYPRHSQSWLEVDVRCPASVFCLAAGYWKLHFLRNPAQHGGGSWHQNPQLDINH